LVAVCVSDASAVRAHARAVIGSSGFELCGLVEARCFITSMRILTIRWAEPNGPPCPDRHEGKGISEFGTGDLRSRMYEAGTSERRDVVWSLGEFLRRSAIPGSTCRSRARSGSPAAGGALGLVFQKVPRTRQRPARCLLWMRAAHPLSTVGR